MANSVGDVSVAAGTALIYAKPAPAVRGPRTPPLRCAAHESASAGHRLGHRFRPPRSALGREPLSNLGRVAAEVPDRAYRALHGSLSANALRGRARDRLRHRTFFVPPRGR